jgi:pyruvate formate lyase activating enzyme
MPALREAEFFEPLAGGAVLCTLCPHRCHVASGGRGACGVRFDEGGRLYTLAHDALIARHPDPIEKKPLFHFFPGSRAYSVATVGCNLRCAFCQNWDTSQWPRDHLPRHVAEGGLGALAGGVPGERVRPAELVAAACATGCASIAHTYTEPTVFYELVVETAALARARGLRNVLVTNGFTEEAPIRRWSALVDAANVDLKSMNPSTYRTVCRARLEPILDAIRLYRALGVWVEVTTLVIPGLNDSDHELGAIAGFVRSVGPDVPWHVSRFFPAYRMLDREPTPLATLHRACAIGRAAGLRHVYEGNVPGTSDTRCHRCGALLVERRGFSVLRNRVAAGRCPDCAEPVAGVGWG